MGKQITSPVKKYPGYCVLPDFYGYGELIAWTDAISKVDEGEQAESVPMVELLPKLEARAKAIIPMVQEWHIEGLPEKPERLPATPIQSAVKLNYWLSGEIWRLINEDSEAVDPTTGDASTGG